MLSLIPAVATSRAAPRTVGLEEEKCRFYWFTQKWPTCWQKPIGILVGLVQELRLIDDIIDEPKRYKTNESFKSCSLFLSYSLTLSNNKPSPRAMRPKLSVTINARIPTIILFPPFANKCAMTNKPLKCKIHTQIYIHQKNLRSMDFLKQQWQAKAPTLSHQMLQP